MKNSRNILVFTLLKFILIGSIAHAQTKLASLFGNQMVLQQNAEVLIWGTDKPNTKINLKTSWGEKANTKTDSNGDWKTAIKTIKAGGPYSITIKGSNNIELQDVLLGEVWLCSGQSNMEMPLSGFPGQPVYGANELIMNSTNNQLRLFHVKRKASDKPLTSCEGLWKNSIPENTAKFSAVAYTYGKILQEILKVPVGIICSSVGGTRVEAWTNNKTLAANGFDFHSIKNSSEITVNSPSALFNAMIFPLIPYTIKGVIWYQGESNRHNAEQYRQLFPAMINSWRKEWNLGDFPFYFTQIAPFDYKPDFNSAFLREAQLHTLQNTINTGMAVTMDIGEKDCIHPAKKTEVAQRLAYWALAKTYGYNGIQYSGPLYKSMKITGNKIDIDFDFAPNGVSSFGKELDHFEIAGENRVFKPAKAIIQRGQLTVYSDLVDKPVAVRYGWKNFVEGSLFNIYGLPASSFRTDDWTE